MLNGRPVSWCSKRESMVALSSIEAKYIALILVAKKATWLRLLLIKLGFFNPHDQHAQIMITKSNCCTKTITKDADIAQEGGPRLSISLKKDNQGSNSLAHNPVFYARIKQINIQHNYICDKVAAKRIKLSYVPTEEMIADILTKPLTHIKFYRFIQ